MFYSIFINSQVEKKLHLYGEFYKTKITQN